MNENKYTVIIQIPDLDLEFEREMELQWETSEGCPASNIEPYEPEIPAETYVTLAEINGYDVYHLFDDSLDDALDDGGV